MSVKTTIFFRTPNHGTDVIEHDPDTLMQTIETIIDEMAGYVDGEDGGVRELVIRVANNDKKYNGDVQCLNCGEMFAVWEAVCWCEVAVTLGEPEATLDIMVECPNCGVVLLQNAEAVSDVEILPNNRD